MTEDIDKVRLTHMLTVYKQVSPLIETIMEVDSRGYPANLESLIEGYEQLPPILHSIKRMPKPSNKELRKIIGDFEKTLEWSIRAGEQALKMNANHAHGAKFATRSYIAMMVSSVTAARGFHRDVKMRLTKIGVELSHPSGY